MSLKEEINALKVQAYDTMSGIDMAQKQLKQITIQMQTKINELQQEKEDDRDTEDQPRQNSN